MFHGSLEFLPHYSVPCIRKDGAPMLNKILPGVNTSIPESLLSFLSYPLYMDKSLFQHQKFSLLDFTSSRKNSK